CLRGAGRPGGLRRRGPGAVAVGGGLVSLQGNLGTGSVSVVLAGVVLSMLPAVAVFLVGQRPLREGITSAGVNR
ncbi:hypothetical protein ABZ372_43340, partial [Streptomyces sp. NPDC005921]